MFVEAPVPKPTHRRGPIFAAALMLAIAACKPSAQADSATKTPEPAAPAAQAQPAVAPAKPAIEASLSVDMAYASLRKTLLDAGWLPLRDPRCRENIGGEASVCWELPEVESCSGDGYCNMRFANANDDERIAVTTYGAYERWNEPGQESALSVKSWEVSPIDAKPAAACLAKDFDAFLKAFASNDRNERAFTAPLVKVAALGGGEDGDDTVVTYEESRDYDDFVLRFRDGKWYLKSQPGDAAPPVPADVAIKAEADGAYFVSLPGNVEGISYRFERRGDCWQLTSDPEAVP